MPATRGADISAIAWIIVVAAAWVVVAAVVGVLVGRMVRERDRQVPPAPDHPTATGGDEDVPKHRVLGRGRQRRS